MTGGLAVLLALVVLGAALAGTVLKRAPVATAIQAVCCGAGALLAISVLALGLRAQFGVAGLSVGIDPLSAAFLLPVFVSGAASGVFNWGRKVPAPVPGLLAAAVAAMLADGAGPLLGGYGAVLAVGVLAGTRRHAGPAAVVSAAALVGVLAILGAPRPALADAAWGLAVPILAVVAAAPALAFPPWHRSGTPVVAGLVGLYLLARLLLDLSGPATPAVWGLFVVAAGAAGSLAGAVGALRAATLPGVAAGAVAGLAGLSAQGLGVALVARGADLPALAGAAFGAALLQAAVLGVGGTLAELGTEAAALGGGSQALDRLGGLAGRMRVTAACLAVAGASVAVLPPSAGFAGWWATVQVLIATGRVGGSVVPLAVTAALAASGLATGLAAAAAVRLLGIALLGRPRTPRAAAADEIGRPGRAVLAGLAAATIVLGLLPGPVRFLLAGTADPAWWWVPATGDAGGLAPLALAVLLAVAGAVATAVAWRAPPVQEGPGWQGGFDPPPPWMPFGDPALQYTAESFAQPLFPVLPSPARFGVTPLGLAAALLAAGLAAVAVFG